MKITSVPDKEFLKAVVESYKLKAITYHGACDLLTNLLKLPINQAEKELR